MLPKGKQYGVQATEVFIGGLGLPKAGAVGDTKKQKISELGDHTGVDIMTMPVLHDSAIAAWHGTRRAPSLPEHLGLARIGLYHLVHLVRTRNATKGRARLKPFVVIHRLVVGYRRHVVHILSGKAHVPPA